MLIERQVPMRTVQAIDNRSRVVRSLPSPAEVRAEAPASPAAQELVLGARRRVGDVLNGDDDRLVVVAGPCSAHDTAATVAYARRLAELAEEMQDSLVVVMRVYVEKPRTRTGWKGLVGDPLLDGSHQLDIGLRLARRLMLDVLGTGLPVACEFLDPLVAPYLADLVSWGSVGARTVQSQPHRQLASGLDMPLGIKNATSGAIEDAVDAIVTAAHGHVLPGIDEHGRAALIRTDGNPDCHVVLRGGSAGPNYFPLDVARTLHQLRSAGLEQRVFIDASHGNSGKDPRRQQGVAADLAERLSAGEYGIAGVMLESFIISGRQDLTLGRPEQLVFGQSITDACSGWDETQRMVRQLGDAIAERRACTPLADAS